MTTADDATDHDARRRIGESEFASLATFRRNGDAVATAVWIAADGDDLVVTTERATGKVKRIRNDSRVTLTPCRRMGTVEAGATTVGGSARISGPDRDDPTATRALRRKYGWQYRGFLTVENLVRRIQRRPGERVIIRISRT